MQLDLAVIYSWLVHVPDVRLQHPRLVSYTWLGNNFGFNPEREPP
jgi:hypothetical protein